MSRSNSKSNSKSNLDTIIPEIDYLYAVVAVRDYEPQSGDELELRESQVLFVCEEKAVYFLCYDPVLKKRGFCPKNYLQRQRPMIVISATCVREYQAIFPDDIEAEVGDKLIAVAKVDDNYVLCKSLVRISAAGKIPISYLEFGAEDIKTLPALEEYRIRTSKPVETPKSTKSRSRSNTGPKLTLSNPNSKEEAKIIEKLSGSTSRGRSHSGARMLQVLSPPKEY